ncbi:hypothetical protein FZ983_04965 [Azospirillum sp. B21]|nr:hypothetical protein FZ983_04965 [Azospirillum sp. B21]
MRRVGGGMAAGHWMVGCSPFIGAVFEFNGLPVIPAEAVIRGAPHGNRPGRLESRLRGNDAQRSGCGLSGVCGRSSPPFPPMRHQSSNARSSRFGTVGVTKVQTIAPDIYGRASPKFRSHAESLRMGASPKFKLRRLATPLQTIGASPRFRSSGSAEPCGSGGVVCPRG